MICLYRQNQHNSAFKILLLDQIKIIISYLQTQF